MRAFPPVFKLGDDGEFASKVFCECVEGFRESNPKREKLLSYKQAVRESASRYDSMVPRKIELFSLIGDALEGDSKDLQSVYTEKFSKRNSPGRHYYDLIIESAPGNVCPICGVGAVSCLDHYLPKSKYPLLSVVPSNLVPLCSRCNDKDHKGDYCGGTYDEMLFHPYFDKPPSSTWLSANLHFDSSPVIEYTVEWPVDAVIERRLVLFFERYGLGELYAVQAVLFLEDMKLYWANQLANGASSLLEMFQDMRESVASSDPLSWKVALFDSLINQYDDVADWLRGLL